MKKRKYLSKKIKKVILITLMLIFSFSVLKNIQYPLLWNDEAEAAMLTRRTMEFGYPKVHDGKNTLYMIRLPEPYKEVAINKSTDAYVGIPWGMIYFGLIGETLSKLSDDMYIKTGLLRFPFALIGIAGLLLFGYSFASFFDEKHKFIFWSVYLSLLITNIHLILHIREVRYYSLVVFTVALFFHQFLKWKIFETEIEKKQIIFFTILLWVSFHVFSPIFFVLAAFLGIIELIKFIQNKDIKNFIIGISPSLLSLILLIPVFIFFRSFEHSAATAEATNFGSFRDITGHTFYILHYFLHYENVWIAIFTFCVIAIFLLKKKLSKGEQKTKVYTSVLLFFGLYLFFISTVPIKVYTRYFIVLLPTLALISTFGIIYFFEITKHKTVFLILVLLLFIGFQYKQRHYLKGHLHEITHQYKGVLDYTIPCIQENYENTEELIIAANYEECSYMYYLNSKVIYGYVGNNLAEDSLITPDIISFRETWQGIGCMKKEVLNKYPSYKKVKFPVYDYPFNNIPELKNNGYDHLFTTKEENGTNKAYLLLRK